ncbi:MAG: GAF domain-containing protein [Chloroflexota bacterium]|nr:GAF domain-containing protein [Chloroflexota bacterium]
MGDTDSLQTHQRFRDRTPLQTWVVVAVLATTVLLLVVAAFLAWRTTQVPFPGLFTEPTLVVNESGDPTWPGHAAGLYIPDHLIALDGRPLESSTALMRELSQYDPGDVVTLTARGEDATLRDVQVRLEPLPTKALANFFVLPWFLGLAYLCVGIWVTLVRRRERSAQVFGLMCAMVALCLGLLFDLYTTHRLPRVWSIAISLTGSVLVHLALVFPQRMRFLDRFPVLRYLVYVPGVIIAIVNQTTLLDFKAPTAYFDTWFAAFVLISAGLIVILAMMVYRYFRSESPIVQAQARTILWGSLLAFSPIVIWFLVTRHTGGGFLPVLILPWFVFFPFSIAYAILRYRLFNVNLVIRRGVVHRQVMRRLASRLTETTGLPSVLQALDETLEMGWSLQFAALFLYDPQRVCYVPHVIGNKLLSPVTFARDGPLAQRMLQRCESIYLYPDRPLPPDLVVESELLKSLCPALFIPVPDHGWMVLGPRRSGVSFSSDDLSTLESLGSQVAVALEKARLFSDLERRMTEVDVLRWVGQAVNFAMDVDDLIELIYAQTSRVLDTGNFYIALYNPEKRTLSFAFYVEEGERLYKDDEWSVEIGLTGEIVRMGRPIVTEDYIQECHSRGVTSGGRPGRAWMGVPLNAGDRIIGVMNISSFDPAVTYSDEQLQFFSAIADQAAAILDKARLYREMEERAQQLVALNEVGSIITSTLDLPVVLNLIMDTAVGLLEAEAGSLVLVDLDTNELIFEVTAGPGSADLVGTRLPPGTGIVGTVVQNREPTIIKDAQSDQRWYQGVDDSTGFVTHSIIAVPMISRGRAIGVIQLLNRRDGVPFDEDDERLLTAFATNAAISIENARLFTQTDLALAARVGELSMMQRIDRELNATLDYNRVMSLTLDWALRTTGADVGVVAVIVETEDGVGGLRFLANQGYPEGLFATYEEKPWPLEQGIIGRVVRTGKPELVESVASDPVYAAAVPDMVAQLTVPIRREEQIIGVIALESSQQGLLNQEALDFVVRLADHAAISIENARLFEEVRRANDAKTEFVSFVSHELKQPMTSMKGYTELLAKGAVGELNDTQRSFLDTIQSNVNRMNMLVSGLLDVSRIESGRIRFNFGDVSVDQMIEDALRTIRGQIEAKQQALEVHISPNLPPVRGDPDRLVQVLTNLVSNAHKYTPEEGCITVRAQRWLDTGDTGGVGKDRFVLCSVTDTGIGMSPEDQKRLFTKYFRSEDPAVRSEVGTGLGLVITKSLVELQGGEIWVESEVGEGSTFAFTIPIARAGKTDK